MRQASLRALVFAALGCLLLGCAPGRAAAPPGSRPLVDPFGDPVTYDLGDPARAIAVVGAAGAGPAQIALARDLLDEVLLVALDGAGVPYARGSVDVGDGPRDVAAIDLDADGKDDLVTADSGDAALSLVHRAADGSFGAAEPAAVDAAPFRLAVADLTGDGVTEIVVASGVADAAALRGWTTSAGGGLAPLGVAVPLAGASRLSAGDVDGDGDADVVAVLDGSAVALALNDGAGALSPTTLDACASPSSTAIGDLDGDGIGDLVVACAGEAVVLFGPVDEASRRLSLGPAAQLYDVVARDLDGDGHVDVVAVDVLAHEALTWLAPAAGGSSEPFRRAVTRGPVAAATGDVDGDGRLDLVILGYEQRQVQVLLGAP